MTKKMFKILSILLTIIIVYFIKIENVSALKIDESYMLAPYSSYDYISPVNPFTSDGKIANSKRVSVYGFEIKYEDYQNQLTNEIFTGTNAEYFVLSRGKVADLPEYITLQGESYDSKGDYGSIGFAFNPLNSVTLTTNSADISLSSMILDNFKRIGKGAAKGAGIAVLAGKGLLKLPVSTTKLAGAGALYGALSESGKIIHEAMSGTGNYEDIDIEYLSQRTNLFSIVEKPISLRNTINSDYIKYENGTFSESNKKEYKDFIKNQSKYTKSKYTLYGDPSMGTDDGNLKQVVQTIVDDIVDQRATGLLSWNQNGFTSSDKIVFASSKLKHKYESNNLATVIENMNKYKESDEQLAKALYGLEIFVDCNDYDTKTYSDVYYNMTKGFMFNFINEYTSSGQIKPEIEQVTKNSFTNWIDLCGRYVLEDGNDGPAKFKKLFEFVFADPTSEKDENGDYKNARTSVTNWGITFSQDEYELIIKSLNDMIIITQNTEALNKLTSDKCLVYCIACLNNESDACTQCTKSNQKSSYTSCTSCIEKCKSVTASEYDNCFNTCLDDKIGEGASEYFNKAYTETVTYYKDSIKNASINLLDNLNKLYETYKERIERQYGVVPNFSFGPYIADCDDVKTVHIIYKILIYLAPALVIVLGGLDYAKAVINADEKKQQKFKQDFKKRVILLVLLILVPVIINLILDVYNRATNSSLDNNLMYCIINGGK